MSGGSVHWANYQEPYQLNNRADFATMSNEDIGFNATLTTATNDTYEYAIPFPSSYDLFEEAMVLYRVDHMFNTEINDVADGETIAQLEIYSSFLQIEFAATFQGAWADAEDEAMKSKLHGPMPAVGQNKVLTSNAGIASDAQTSHMVDMNFIQCLHEYMINDEGYDLFTPYYYTLVNKSVSHAGQTGILAAANFTSFERFMQRLWHKKRRLTTDERSFRMVAARFMHIDT